MRAALLIAALLSSVAAGVQARSYGMLDYSCARPPEGYIEIGDGWFTLTETRYTRQGDKTPMPDGWFSARYSSLAEGVEQPAVTIEMRITPQEIEIRHEDGREFRGTACP